MLAWLNRQCCSHTGDRGSNPSASRHFLFSFFVFFSLYLCSTLYSAYSVILNHLQFDSHFSHIFSLFSTANLSLDLLRTIVVRIAPVFSYYKYDCYCISVIIARKRLLACFWRFSLTWLYVVQHNLNYWITTEILWSHYVICITKKLKNKPPVARWLYCINKWFSITFESKDILRSCALEYSNFAR